MINFYLAKIKSSPLGILWIVFSLILIGLISLNSISVIDSQSSSGAFKKQLIFLIPSILLMLGSLLLSKKFIHERIYYIYIISIAFVSLPFLGNKVQGTYRWIDLGLPFNVQPSEAVKWIAIIALARFLSDRDKHITNFSTIIYSLPLLLIPSIIVFNQPDLGTASVLLSPAIPMLYWAGAKPYHLFLIIAPFLSILSASNVIIFTIWIAMMALVIFIIRKHGWYGIAIFFINIFLGLIFPLVWNSLRDYQKNRVLTFINPELDPLGAGYQIIQSKTALGSGGLWGKGWGEGTQTQLKFLPVQESDFIVSVIGEELGFVALFVMIILFSIFMYRILSLSLNASDKFSGLILIGISSIFLSHIFVNCAMVSGMMPVKGLPLPFISYGGSFLISCFIMVGLILNFGREKSY